MLNNKILYIFPLIIFTNCILASEDIVKINYADDSEPSLIKYSLTKDQEIIDPLIILDSKVIKFDENTMSTNKQFTKLGQYFMYEINTNKLKEIDSIQDKEFSMKLAKYQDSNSYQISDGTFIVAFKDQININDFAKEYNIILLRDFSDIKLASFKSNDFRELDSKIANIRSDSRISYVRYDLINPEPALR